MKRMLYLLVTLLVITSCGKDDDANSGIDGAWLLQGYWDFPGHCPAQNTWEDDGRSVWEFKSGTLTKGSSTGTYTIEEGKLITNFSNSKITFEMKLEGDKLVLTKSDYPHSSTSGYSSCKHSYNYIFERTNSTGNTGGGNNPSSGVDNAPSSLSGKTIYLSDRNVKVTISGSSCRVAFIRDNGVSIMTGTPSYSYSKGEKNKARFTLNYKTNGTMAAVANYSSSLSLTLDFLGKTDGTYSGSNNYSSTGAYTESGTNSVLGLFDLK